MKKIPPIIDGIYKLENSDDLPTSLVLDSPHSGTAYPDDFKACRPVEELKKYEDHNVDELFGDAARQNAIPFLQALFPRTYIDPNRSQDDINLKMIDGDWPYPASPTPRCHAGHGLIRETIGNKLIYDHKLRPAEIEHRLNTYYRPYHHTLKTLLDSTYDKHGSYFHINCHSMASSALTGYYPIKQPDFIIGDLDGTSCNLTFRNNLKTELETIGYIVAINIPYKGVEIVRRYGDPARNKNSLQLEINKALFLTEDNKKIDKKFNKLKENIETLIQNLSATATTLVPHKG